MFHCFSCNFFFHEVLHLETSSVSSTPTHAVTNSCLFYHLDTSISFSLHSTPTATALIQACRLSYFVQSSCLILCDPMDYSISGFPVLNHLPEFAQTHVHWVGDDIQPSHPLSSPSPPAFNLSQHQSFPMSLLFSSGGQSSISPSSEYSGLISRLISLISLLSKGHSRVFSSTTVQKQHMKWGRGTALQNTHLPAGARPTLLCSSG